MNSEMPFDTRRRTADARASTRWMMLSDELVVAAPR